MSPTAHKSQDPLALDVQERIGELERFLRDEVTRAPRHRGYVVGLSGGIDSAVVAALCVRAVGKERVHAVLLPERESGPEGVEHARRLAGDLGVAATELDISSALEALGVYRERESIIESMFGDFEPGWRYRLLLPGDLHRSRALSVYRVEVVRPDGERMSRRPDVASLLRLQACTNVKQRLRMCCLYREAESRRFLVCGTTNRTEASLGFFVRYGDGGVDVEPLIDLYKTQVRALAVELGILPEIVAAVPSPDTWSAPVSDEEFYLRLDYEELDRVLAHLERGEGTAEMAGILSMEPERIDDIRREIERRKDATARHRELPAVPQNRRERT